jgi:hypothetical protein
LKKLIIISLSLLLLVILIPGCITFQTPTSLITPPAAQPSVGTFSSSPSTINQGGTSTLMWNVTGASSVSIDNGIGQVDIAGTRVISPASSTVYTLSATNSAGTVTRTSLTSVVLQPVVTPSVIIGFNSRPNSDGTSTLVWNVTGASSVSIDHGIGQVYANGSLVVSPASSTVYILSATNNAGTVTRSAVTTVNSASPPAVIVQFSSNLNADGTSTLAWYVTGADTVSIDNYIGIVSASGSKIVSPDTSTVYTLSATYALGNWANEIGTVSRSVIAPANVGEYIQWVP